MTRIGVPGGMPDPTTLDWLKKLFADGCVDPVPTQPQNCKITEVVIQSVGDLVRIVELWHTGSCQYRGQAEEDRELFPSLTRPASTTRPAGPGLSREKHILKQFRNEAAAYYSGNSIDRISDLELVMIIQHCLGPTRLLDWTLNPLAALYFAVEGDCKGAYSVVWAVPGDRFFKSDVQTTTDLDQAFHNMDHPSSLLDATWKGRPFFVFPDHSISRAAVQGSLFAIWSDPRKTFLQAAGDTAELWKIKIPKDSREGIRWGLYCLGITRSTLFPDLDGLAACVSWKHTDNWETIYFDKSRPKPRP